MPSYQQTPCGSPLEVSLDLSDFGRVHGFLQRPGLFEVKSTTAWAHGYATPVNGPTG